MASNTGLILDNTGTLAVLEGWTSFEWVRDYYDIGNFKLVISSAFPASPYLVKGNFILPPNEKVIFLIETVERDTDLAQGSSEDMLTVTGRDFGGLFAERLCLPPVGQAYDTKTALDTESILKYYITNNAASGTSAARQIPGLGIAPYLGRGDILTTQARYQYLSDVVIALSKVGGLGWEITYNKGGLFGDYTFDVFIGVNRSQTVKFDTRLGTVLAQRWLSSDLGRKTCVYVAGQNSGVSRVIVIKYADGIEPTGFNRRETFVDARDIADTSTLSTRGYEKLAEVKLEDSFEVTINPTGLFKYKTDWNLGDLVTLSSKQWGLSKQARIVKIKFRLDSGSGANPDIDITLDKPFPSFKEAVKQFAITASTAD